MGSKVKDKMPNLEQMSDDELFTAALTLRGDKTWWRLAQVLDELDLRGRHDLIDKVISSGYASRLVTCARIFREHKEAARFSCNKLYYLWRVFPGADAKELLEYAKRWSFGQVYLGYRLSRKTSILPEDIDDLPNIPEPVLDDIHNVAEKLIRLDMYDVRDALRLIRIVLFHAQKKFNIAMGTIWALAGISLGFHAWDARDQIAEGWQFNVTPKLREHYERLSRLEIREDKPNAEGTEEPAPDA